MSQIKIKGIGMIHVDQDTFKQIDVMKADSIINKKDPYIKAGKWSGFLSDVIGLIDDPDVNLGNQASEKIQNDFYTERKDILRQSPENRACNLGMFRLLFFTIAGFPSSTETDFKAINIQKEFFLANPKRCLCDANVLLAIIPRKSEGNPFAINAMGIAERAIREDIRLSK